MKNIFKWFFLMVFLLNYKASDAQFFKKLKNKVEQKADKILSEKDTQGESIIIMGKGNLHIFVETAGMEMQIPQSMMVNNKKINPTDQMANYDYANLKKTGNTITILGAKYFEYVM